MHEVGASGIQHLCLVAHSLFHGLQQRFVLIEAGNQAPCARHVALAVAQRADKGYASLFLQGQYLAIVLQKYECLGGNVAGLRAVGWSEDLFLGTLLVAIAIRVGKESELPLGLQDASAGGVDSGFRHLAFGYRLSQRATITVRHHVHVGTGVQGKCRYGLEIAQTVVHHLGDGSIVGHDHSLEAPHATQHIGKQPAVGGGRYALEGVEGGHYTHGACIDGGLVGRHVIVEHAPAAHVDRVIIAPRLRATVKSKMFDARHHCVWCRQIGALIAFNHGAGNL